MVMQGIDPKTRSSAIRKVLIQAQIKEIQADKSMKAAEKKEAIAELNQAIKGPPADQESGQHRAGGEELRQARRADAELRRIALPRAPFPESQIKSRR